MTESTETQPEVFTKEQLEAQIEAATVGLRAKVDELLGETKTAKQRARELEESQEAAALERAKEKGEFKELYEREQKSKNELAEKYELTLKTVRQKEIDAATNELASSQTRDVKRAELLRKELAQYAVHGEDGVAFELGGVRVDKSKVLAHISELYPFLIDGNGSSGGGANGTHSSGSAAQAVISRSDFDAMNETNKRAFLSKGGKLTD